MEFISGQTNRWYKVVTVDKDDSKNITEAGIEVMEVEIDISAHYYVSSTLTCTNDQNVAQPLRYARSVLVRQDSSGNEKQLSSVSFGTIPQVTNDQGFCNLNTQYIGPLRSGDKVILKTFASNNGIGKTRDGTLTIFSL